MQATKAQIVEALRPVKDPEIGMSIVELGMVRDVQLQDSQVTVVIALTTQGCPLRAEITSRVTEALSPLVGVGNVAVEMTVMSPEELETVRSLVQGGGHQTGASHLHGPDQRAIPFANPNSKTRVIGITSGKGGVGKSSVTVNLAVALAKLGKDVAVLDADVYGFSIPKMLGVTQEPDVVEEMIVPPVAHGVKCVSIGFFVDDDKPVMWRGPMLHKALEQFLVDVAWDSPDYLLIDMPPGTGDVAMSMAQYLPRGEIYVVTTPQAAAQRVAQRSGSMARELGLPLAGVIENMSWFTGDDGKRYELFGAGGGQALAEKLGVPVVAQVPFVSELREGGDIGAPVVITDPESEVAFVFEQLAQVIEKTGPRRVYREELRIR